MTAALTPQYVNSPYRVIDNAYHESGLLEDGQEPDSEQISKGMIRLNDLMSLWQTQGLKLWLQSDLPITLVQGLSPYTLGTTGNIVMTRPTRIIEAYYADSNQVNRPIFVYARSDWDTLSQRNVQGPLNSIFVDKQVPYLIVNVWQLPDAQTALGKLHLIIQQQQPVAVALTDNLLFGPEWFLALIWGLADQFTTGQPQAVINRCQQKAVEYRTMLEDWDVEDASTTFVPDSRIQTTMSKFI